MKRIYSYSYIERKTGSPLGVTEWAMAKCRELGQLTGVKWVSAFYGGTMRLRFSPVLHFRDIEATGTKADQDWIAGVVLILAEGRTGGVVGCVDLGDVLEATDRREPRFVLGVVKALVSDDRLRLQVNRQGRPTMVFIPRE